MALGCYSANDRSDLSLPAGFDGLWHLQLAMRLHCARERALVENACARCPARIGACMSKRNRSPMKRERDERKRQRGAKKAERAAQERARREGRQCRRREIRHRMDLRVTWWQPIRSRKRTTGDYATSGNGPSWFSATGYGMTWRACLR